MGSVAEANKELDKGGQGGRRNENVNDHKSHKAPETKGDHHKCRKCKKSC